MVNPWCEPFAQRTARVPIVHAMPVPRIRHVRPALMGTVLIAPRPIQEY